MRDSVLQAEPKYRHASVARLGRREKLAFSSKLAKPGNLRSVTLV